ncbi:junctional adhesion molecule B-like [Poecilia latipinna]|uniref:junctional adhesion molecule B-like n=1 Tax=Poecilia latipinna TaxID=48699 RepID=UPI00072EBE8E|nr:PREDICTED: junctional adhesion molecule B-like [Poecilia latipinna]
MKGSSVTLTCSSDANPAANYSWRKNNNHSVVSKDQQFVLSSILSSDSGQYYCTAQNELGEKTSGPVSVQVTCQSMSSITSRLALLILISMLVQITTLRTMKAMKKPTKLSDPEEMMEMRNVIEIT